MALSVAWRPWSFFSDPSCRNRLCSRYAALPLTQKYRNRSDYQLCSLCNSKYCTNSWERLQVWNLVAGESPSINKPQFYSTLRLISLAQVYCLSVSSITSVALLFPVDAYAFSFVQRSNGNLEEAQARSVLIGVGPQVPPPQMQGLETRVATSINSSWTHNPAVMLPSSH